MKCADCSYYWKTENEDFARCHYDYGDGYAPCEVEDSEYREEADDEEVAYWEDMATTYWQD